MPYMRFIFSKSCTFLMFWKFSYPFNKAPMWRIKVNQIIIMLIIILRTYQVIINILAGGFTPLVIEITVGLLAIIPTLDAIASIEAKTDAYVAKKLSFFSKYR